MTRAIQNGSYALPPLDPIDPMFADDEQAKWLLAQADKYSLTTLLAHADDGLIWGAVREGQLKLSGQVFPAQSPQLSGQTLQQLRLFGEHAEVFVWRDGQSWRGRVLVDAPGNEPRYFDETQIQVGDHVEERGDGFTLVAEGREGLEHAVPFAAEQIPFGPDDWRYHPLRLTVRHYLDREADGTLVIAHSRLVRLTVEAPQTQEAANG